MRFSSIKSWVASLCVLALVACGGGGSAGDPVLGGGGGGGAGAAAKVDIQASNKTLGDGDSTVQIVAIVKDASDVGVANATVAWSFDAGYLTDSSSTTDANGRVTATFAALDRAKGTANIKLTAGTVSGSVAVSLKANRIVTVDTPAKVTGVAINGATATITATVTDPDRVAIAGAKVAWATSAGTLKDVVSVTDARGVATAVFDAAGVSVGTTAVVVTAYSAEFSNAVSIPISSVSKVIEILADATTIGTGGDQVVIRAIVKNGLTNGALPSESVSWTTTTGTLTNETRSTNSSGVATATLSAGADKRNRDAVVTVRTAGNESQQITIPIVDTKINYSGTTSLALDSTVTTNLTFSLADSKGLSIPGESLAFTSSLGNSLLAAGPTNSAGQVLVAYRPTVAGVDRIEARGAGAKRTIEITVSGNDEKLTFEQAGGSSTVAVGQSRAVTLKYLRGGVPQAGKSINLAATVGALSSASVVTDATGTANFSVRSSFAGTSTITAAAADSTLRSTTQISFVATQPHKLILQVTRSALPPSTDADNLQVTTVSAKVIDSNFNPVPNVTVNFSQEADPSQGILQQASADTDLSGVATVLYQSGPTSTASGAVVLRGTVASAPSVLGSTNLTVNERALFIVLGTGNTITNFDEQTYLKNWNIYVTDANGVRVPNKLVTVKVLPTAFRKGYLVWSEIASLWVDAIPPLSCPSEDSPENPGFSLGTFVWSPVNVKPGNFDFNGFLDPGEDLNADGVLTPGNVVLLNSSVVTTDANGFATVALRYSENYVPWVKVRLTATATVEGTESTAFKEFDLSGLAGDFSVKTIAPAGVVSPFGRDTATCNNKL